MVTVRAGCKAVVLLPASAGTTTEPLSLAGLILRAADLPVAARLTQCPARAAACPGTVQPRHRALPSRLGDAAEAPAPAGAGSGPVWMLILIQEGGTVSLRGTVPPP
jgi:hypothetical protein